VNLGKDTGSTQDVEHHAHCAFEEGMSFKWQAGEESHNLHWDAILFRRLCEGPSSSRR
jgi:hypothetical protein